MMMLFSVVGRRDETGFSDRGALGRKTYESFRTTSAREYLQYCQKEEGTQALREDHYLQALVVELMGYPSLETAIQKGAKPELLIDYIIAKNDFKGEDARQRAHTLLINKLITLETLFTPKALNKANEQLAMMNLAHGLDLSRCYPLYPKKKHDDSPSANYNGTLKYFLLKNGFLNDKKPEMEKLTDFFNLIRSSFDSLMLTGQKTTFGWISKQQFEENKDKLLMQVSEIQTRFKDPAQQKTLEQEAAAAALKSVLRRPNEDDGTNPFQSLATGEQLLKEYCEYLCINTIINTLTNAPQLTFEHQMFDFHQMVPKTAEINYHQNATRLVSALNTVVPQFPGLEEKKLAKISNVDHDKQHNQVRVFFDNHEQAARFTETYNEWFSGTLEPIASTVTSESMAILVNRQHYQQLVNDRLVEFEQVKIPTVISGDHKLVDVTEGFIEAIQLIQKSEALGRLLSTSARDQQGSVPAYEYFFNALDNPATERFTRKAGEDINRSVYHHPKTGEIILRTIESGSVPDLRFQEPITKPGQFEEKKDDWQIRSERSQPKNTIFTKKMAHSLLPPHGKIIPFSGFKSQESNFFPIGVLSDIKQVDLKSERYVWSENMITIKTSWIRDDAVANKAITQALRKFKKPQKMLDYSAKLLEEVVAIVEAHVADIVSKLNSKQYRPTVENLTKFAADAEMQKQSALAHFDGNNPDLERRITEAYQQLQDRLTQEIERKHPKYSITIKDLIAEQKKNQEASPHNEILAANTKSATRALYASKDELFDRLNLAFHARNIKQKHGIDVPLLILSQNKPPYHYTEAMIKADLIKACEHLKEGSFPYDNYPLYQLDEEQNEIKDADGKPIPLINEDGTQKTATKFLEYQQQMLVDLFQLGSKKLTRITELHKAFREADAETISKLTDRIITKLELVGGVSRERVHMEDIFPKGSEQRKNKFFLRNVTLGNEEIVRSILEMDGKDFKITTALLDKAVKFADQNGHTSLKILLTASLEELKSSNVHRYKSQLHEWKKELDSPATNIVAPKGLAS